MTPALERPRSADMHAFGTEASGETGTEVKVPMALRGGLAGLF